MNIATFLMKISLQLFHIFKVAFFPPPSLVPVAAFILVMPSTGLLVGETQEGFKSRTLSTAAYSVWGWNTHLCVSSQV